MMEFIDTGLLGVILATVIYLVKKTTTLCHDVEKLKKWGFELKGKNYYVIFQVDLYDNEEPTKENILPLFEGLEYDDLFDSFVSIDER